MDDFGGRQRKDGPSGLARDYTDERGNQDAQSIVCGEVLAG